MTWQANWIRSQSGFDSAQHILEIGAGAFATTISLAKRYPTKRFYGLDFVLSPSALQNLSDAPENLTVIKHDARDLKLLSPGNFDLAFSVAVMEHIHELSDHLVEVHRVLAPNGHYWFWEAPFWSSSLGHHFEHSKPTCPVPHYAHLYLTEPEMKELLASQNLDGSRIEYVLDRIYRRGDLSRLSQTQTRSIIQQSDFSICEWTEQLDDNYTPQLEKRVLDRNLYQVPADDLRVKGVKCCLRKGAASP